MRRFITIAALTALCSAPILASAQPTIAPPIDAPAVGSASAGSSDALFWMIRCTPIGPLIALGSALPDDGFVFPGMCGI